MGGERTIKGWKLIVASLLLVYVGGLLSLGQLIGVPFWTGLFLMAIGIGWLGYHQWGRPQIETPEEKTVKQLTDETKLEPEETKSFENVLSFYGVQLQSHAAMLLGSLVGVFALAQVIVATKSIAFSVPFGVIGAIGLGLMVWFTLFLASYVLMRLMVYGIRANAILTGRISDFKNQFRGDGFFPQARAHLFSDWFWRERYPKTRKRRLLDGYLRARRVTWLLMLALTGLGALSLMLIGR